MNLSALIMFLVGASMLWGGLLVCLRIAFKKRGHNADSFAQEE